MKTRIVRSSALAVVLFTALFLYLPQRVHAASCVSAASGNWNSPATWTSCNGGTPGAADDVTIQSTHQITLTQNESVNNLTIQNAATRLTGAFILEVNGTLNSDTTTLNANIISSSTTIRFVGSNSRALFGANWGAATTGLVFEVALEPGATGTNTGTNIKARSITISGGTFNMTGSLLVDAGSANSGSLTINSGGTLIVNSSLSRTTTPNTPFANFTINGTGIFRTTSTAANVWPSATPTTFSSTSTVEYAGASQTIQTATYGNLRISGTGTKTAATSPLNINGDLNINASVLSAPAQINIAGNFTNNATFTPGTNTVTFNGSAAQTIGGTSATAFNNLTVNNSGSGVSLGQNATVNGVLTLTTDLTTTDNYILTLGSSATVSGPADVVGTVRRTSFSGAQTYNNANTQITFSATPPTQLDIRLFKGNPGELTNYVARRYTLTPTGSFTTATVQMAYQDSEFVGIANESNLQLWRHNGTRWELMGGTVNTLDNFVLLPGVTQLSPWAISDSGTGSPTAITLSSFGAHADDTTANAIPLFALLSLSLLTTIGMILFRRSSA
jgi:hypothetical protein